jgi:ABC-type bacteriocin/lantibiotic exporter with double-glycine peptidase domain
MAAKAVTENSYFHKVFRSGYKARAAISVAVYNKALRLANSERQSTTLGELVNLMQVDASKIEAFIPQVHVLWDGMLQIVGYTAILYTLIGWPCFIGLVMIAFSGPLQGIAQKKQVTHNHSMAKLADSRIKTTNEALQGISCVKMYTWEQNFEQQITGFRDSELEHLKAIAYL